MTFKHLTNQLSQCLRNLSDEQGANAAVALLLKDKTNPSILFVKRVTNPNDPWSGQIGLPGGKRDIEDNSLKNTIIRETLEETGIDLNQCHFFGVMSAQKSRPRPEIKVLPFVILLDHEPVIVLSWRELERYVWIPIENLAENRTFVKFPTGEYPAFVIDANVIWGLTYRIIEELIEMLNLSKTSPTQHKTK
jgi:8-oxo-dGTP pyrophosphatase MutT (NUDIX family)